MSLEKYLNDDSVAAVVCMRCTDLPAEMAAEQRVRFCEECGSEVWFTSTTNIAAGLLPDVKRVVPICIRCFADSDIPVSAAGTLEEAVNEAREHLGGDFDADLAVRNFERMVSMLRRPQG